MKDSGRMNKTINCQLCTVLNIVLLFIILILIARTVLFPQSLVYNAHLNQANEMKKLIEETSKLLKDLSSANVALPESVKSDIKLIQEDLSQGHDADPGIFGQESLSKTPSSSSSQLLLQKLQKDLQECSLKRQEIDENLVECHLDHQNRGKASIVTSDSDKQKWLVIGIPTVARPNNEDYLLQTLAAMADQFPANPSDLFYRRVLVVVVNVQAHEIDPNPHLRFEEAVRIYAAGNHAKSDYFRFIKADQSEVTLALDPKKGQSHDCHDINEYYLMNVLGSIVKGNDLGSANVPGRMVRKQTRDLALVITRSVDIGEYYLFLEDDMKFCPHGLTSIQYLLNKASLYHPDWLAIRASYGMNGVFMHNKDLSAFAQYLLTHQTRRPPDHLVVEWFAGETPESKAYKNGRANIGFRYNLFDHLGVSSSLRSAKQTSFPKCYDNLIVPTVFEVEAFSPKECPRDDIWPCSRIHPSAQMHLDLASMATAKKLYHH